MKATLMYAVTALVMFVRCSAYLHFSERMIPTFLLPLFDKNDDGVLTDAEVKEVKSHLPSFGFNDRQAHILMEAADNDNDGRLEPAEFHALYQQIMAEQIRRIEEVINS